jgi:hypothetical protein
MNDIEGFYRALFPHDAEAYRYVFSRLPRPLDKFPRTTAVQTVAALMSCVDYHERQRDCVYVSPCLYAGAAGRTARNIMGSRAIWAMLRVGSEQRYETKEHALDAVDQLAAIGLLPAPITIEDATTLHAIWLLPRMLSGDAWRFAALGLHAYCDAYGVDVDRAQGLTMSALLPAPGTVNRHDGGVWRITLSPIGEPLTDEIVETLQTAGRSEPAERRWG